MSKVHVRLILARFEDDEVPCVVSACDASIWEHMELRDEETWRKQAEGFWGVDPTDCEWREVWATFSADALKDAMSTPIVEGEIS